MGEGGEGVRERTRCLGRRSAFVYFSSVLEGRECARGRVVLASGLILCFQWEKTPSIEATEKWSIDAKRPTRCLGLRSALLVGLISIHVWTLYQVSFDTEHPAGKRGRGCKVVEEVVEDEVARSEEVVRGVGTASKERAGARARGEGVAREFENVQAWLVHVRSVHGGGGGQGGEWGGDAWKCVHVGGLSLGECAQRYAAGDERRVEVGENGGEDGGAGEAWDLEMGVGGVEEERVKLALRVRLNELRLLDNMHRWIGKCGESA